MTLKTRPSWPPQRIKQELWLLGSLVEHPSLSRRRVQAVSAQRNTYRAGGLDYNKSMSSMIHSPAALLRGRGVASSARVGFGLISTIGPSSAIILTKS